MPLKKHKLHHHTHTRHKRTKTYLKVYAPYIPLLLIVGSGLFVSTGKEFANQSNQVLSYATNISDQGLIEATNKERLERGEKALVFSAKLDRAAQTKANDMSTRNYWSHNTPDGKEPWYFINKVGYRYFKAAENLAYGFNTSGGTVNGWMNSPGHRANILDRDLTEVGFGIANIPSYQNKGPETLVVAMYGLPVGGHNPASLAPQKPQSNGDSTNALKQEQKISYIQSLTGGQAPWSSFVAGIIMGLIVMYLLLKHGRTWRRAFGTSERFIIQHPLLDSTLIALMALAAIVTQTIGTIH